MEKIFEQFVNLYSLSKTLKFELIPMGRTKEYVEINGIIDEDIQRSENYQKMKGIIDDYHKFFIEKSLEGFALDDVIKYKELYFDRNRNENEFEKLKENMRKKIAKNFNDQDEFKKLFKSDLITEVLPKYFDKNLDELRLIDEFKKFSTYFKGFHENRKNIYVGEEKSTAVAYRIIDQNLPKFLENLEVFYILKEVLPDKLEIIEKELIIPLEGKTLEDFFSLDGFNIVLSQSGIDRYNYIIGGYNDDTGKKLQGLNENINLYNQGKPHKEKIPKLKPLYKQILSDRESLSFLLDEFKTFDEIEKAIESFNEHLKTNVIEWEDDKNIKSIFENLNKYDLNKIYIKNDTSLTDVSQRLYGDWSIIKTAINEHYDIAYSGKKKINTLKYTDEKENALKKVKSYSIGFINQCLEEYNRKYETNFSYVENLFKDFKYDSVDFYELIEESYKNYHISDKEKKENRVQLIKAYLDNVKNLQWFVKLLMGKGDEAEKDEKFYSDFLEAYKNIDEVTPLYNKVRNFATKKPYSTEKIKLNFGTSQLLEGWAIKNERANLSMLFKDEKFYYLGIMNKNFKKDCVFKNQPLDSSDIFYKMEYSQIADSSKVIQNLMEIDGVTVKKNGSENVSFEELKNTYLPADINDIRKKKTYLLGKNFDKNDLVKFIDFYKERFKGYVNYKIYDINFKDSNMYNNFKEFTDHINSQAYNLKMREISRLQVDSLVEEGKLYLFKIYNKDFSEFSKGTPNLHTLYWKMLFEKDNLKNPVYKLNGGGEMFYRKASIKYDKPTHEKNVPIKNKYVFHNKEQSVFSYDLIKDKRYTVDKFHLHIPITLNFKAEEVKNLNLKVKEAIKDNSEDIYVIGIDRGERHLLYVTLIDPKGKIIEQVSYNTIEATHNDKVYKVDYHKILDKRETDRDKARKDWKNIENIKEIKEGYLSQVVHKVSELMIKYNAIVVLEDLNSGFKNSRHKVEKQVYQKFEKMLISKLNYYVDKKINPSEYGGLLKAYQLSEKFESFAKLNKQSGFLFYIPAWLTSKIDPTTGFTNQLYLKYKSVEDSIEVINKFLDIRYNEVEKHFEFDVDYNDFTKKTEGTKTLWTLCTNSTRIITERSKTENNKFVSREIVLVDEFIALFEKYNIDYKKGELKTNILNIREKDFFYSFINLLKLTLQMRNSKTNSDIDYLISPVKNKNGEFYDSRKGDETLPKDADANGAYNIARKGLWVIEQIKQAEKENLGKVKLAMTNKEWLMYTQR